MLLKTFHQNSSNIHQSFSVIWTIPTGNMQWQMQNGAFLFIELNISYLLKNYFRRSFLSRSIYQELWQEIFIFLILQNNTCVYRDCQWIKLLKNLISIYRKELGQIFQLWKKQAPVAIAALILKSLFLYTVSKLGDLKCLFFLVIALVEKLC